MEKPKFLVRLNAELDKLGLKLGKKDPVVDPVVPDAEPVVEPVTEPTPEPITPVVAEPVVEPEPVVKPVELAAEGTTLEEILNISALATMIAAENITDGYGSIDFDITNGTFSWGQLYTSSYTQLLSKQEEETAKVVKLGAEKLELSEQLAAKDAVILALKDAKPVTKVTQAPIEEVPERSTQESIRDLMPQ